MLLGDFKLNSGQINISTGRVGGYAVGDGANVGAGGEKGESFADILNREISQKGGVEFSGHALRRIESRSVALDENSRLERLNKGVELAAQKGSNDALVLIDSTAFVVSVKNNKVITALSGADLAGSVFTNIDSAIIM